MQSEFYSLVMGCSFKHAESLFYKCDSIAADKKTEHKTRNFICAKGKISLALSLSLSLLSDGNNLASLCYSSSFM